MRLMRPLRLHRKQLMAMRVAAEVQEAVVMVERPQDPEVRLAEPAV